jgi:hypothetical protein
MPPSETVNVPKKIITVAKPIEPPAAWYKFGSQRRKREKPIIKEAASSVPKKGFEDV